VRLRPGEAGAQPIDGSSRRRRASNITAISHRGSPGCGVDALRRVYGEPVVVAELVEKPRFALDEAAEFVANGNVGGRCRSFAPS
jgi:hypothetical protein